MQLFQQRLQQTALMAQQLLAHQMAGQAARRSSSRPGSVNNSRPASAAAAQRPGSAHGAAMQLTRGLAGSKSAGDSAGNGSSSSAGFRLTPRLAALGVDEPPSAAEVAEYAAYLGMDPQEVSEAACAVCHRRTVLSCGFCRSQQMGANTHGSAFAQACVSAVGLHLPVAAGKAYCLVGLSGVSLTL
jgi:hypothetical protein